MTDTSQEIPGNLGDLRSEWQTARPEKTSTKEELIKQYADKQSLEIEEIYNGVGGQLSVAAHHLACRGT